MVGEAVSGRGVVNALVLEQDECAEGGYHCIYNCRFDDKRLGCVEVLHPNCGVGGAMQVRVCTWHAPTCPVGTLHWQQQMGEARGRKCINVERNIVCVLCGSTVNG